jgi:hypothetical protein
VTIRKTTELDDSIEVIEELVVKEDVSVNNAQNQSLKN